MNDNGIKHSAGLYTSAAVVALVNALVHFSAAIVAGPGKLSMPTIVVGVVWLLFAMALKAKIRWLSYFAFLLSLFGAIFAFANLPSNSLPQWVSWTTIGLSTLLAIIIFVIIWRNKYQSTSRKAQPV